MLDGIRIIDLSTVIMGPLASRMLADLGADVVKVESPNGDSTRAYRPHMAPGISGMFLNLNRNKRSIVLDLKSEQGKRTLEDLVRGADIFLHNLRPSVMRRLGFDYARCRELNPHLIYCGAYGFGIGGPYSEKPAYDDLIQAASGFAALSHELSGAPSYAPSVICDKIAGQAIAMSILAALFHRSKTGEGQAIEVPMFEVAIDFNLVEHFGGVVFDPPRGKPGYGRIRSPERRPFATSDGYACILPYSDKNWRDFFEFTGRKDLAADGRYASIETRQDLLGNLYAEVRKEAVRFSTEEWVDFCSSVDIPCMPVIEIADVLDDPHVRAVNLISVTTYPGADEYKVIRPPVRFSRSEFQLRRHAPRLGEHTDEVLAELNNERVGSDTGAESVKS